MRDAPTRCGFLFGVKMATSKLQELTAKKLFQTLPSLTIKENFRPDWMDNGEVRLELDFYIPDYKIAIEVQGEQHYRYVEFFHGEYSGFLEQQKRDEDKRVICRLAGIRLVEISSLEELKDFVFELKNKYQQYGDFLSNRKAFFEHETILQEEAIDGKIRRQRQKLELKKIERNTRLNGYEKQRDIQIEAAINKINRNFDKRINRMNSEIEDSIDKLDRLVSSREEMIAKNLQKIPMIWEKYCKKNNITST